MCVCVIYTSHRIGVVHFFSYLSYRTGTTFLAFHHLLGFDHFYFFYRTEVTILDNWHLLVSNPIVTLIEWNDRGTLESYYDQAAGTEVECLTNYAAHYDWVYIADIDEYLYLGNKHRTNDPTLMTFHDDGTTSARINQEENGYIVTPFSSNDDENEILTVKELLHIYDNMTQLSFGKRQYSLDHRTMNDIADAEDSPPTMTNYQIQTVSQSRNGDGSTKTTLRPATTFVVSKYPYYLSAHFCHHRGIRRGETICPTWRGRSKVMVRPQYHDFIDVHGRYGVGDLRKSHILNGTVMHFHPDLYHIKEWPHLYSKHNITIHYPPSSSNAPGANSNTHVNNNYYIDNYDNFTILNETEVSIHNVHTGYLPFYINDVNGTPEEVFLMKRDVALTDYFQKVMNLATTSKGDPIRIKSKQ